MLTLIEFNNEEIMTHVFHAYATYKVPFVRESTVLLDKAQPSDPSASFEAAFKLAPEGFTVMNLSPGLVDASATATAPEEAPDPAVQETLARVMAEFERKGLKALMQTPAQSVRLQLDAIYGLTKEQNGLILSPTTKVSVPALAPKSE